MKILYVITGLGLGGAEKVVVDLADKMHEKGHDVQIAYLKGEAIVKPISKDIPIHYLGLESPKDAITASRNYRRLISNLKPDVIHAHMVHANIFARLNRIGSRAYKLICTAHSSNEGGALRMIAYRLTNSLSDLDTNVSKEALDFYIQKKAFSSNKSIVIYNGINLNVFQNTHREAITPAKTCLSVGRLVEPKDYPTLLRSIPLVLQRYPQTYFNIVGSGEEEEKLKKLCENLNIKSAVSFLGVKNNIPELMNNSDLFILSSKYEGFGLVVAEAMACERFVVATDCGGVKEVMGGNGILVPPENYKKLAEAIISALSLPKDEINKNNAKALHHVQKNFDLTKIIDQWEKIYAK